jgi:site-specific recombinase XerC
LKGKRERAMLALLISCGLRRAELVALEVNKIQQREGRWVIPYLAGKGSRLRTVTIPAVVKVRINAWITAATITEGRVFRPVNKGDRVAGRIDRRRESHLAAGRPLRPCYLAWETRAP